MTAAKLKRLSLGLMAVGAASATVVSSGAFVVSTDDSAANSVTAANVALRLFTPAQHESADPDDTAAGTVLLDAADLRPGAPARETVVEMQNAGDVPTDLAITQAGDGGPDTAALLQALRLTVEDCAGDDSCSAPALVHTGSLAATGTVALPNPLPAGESRYVRLRLTWPAENDDPALYGLATEIAFHWSATTR
jgi:hypothetical protein